MNKKIRQQVFDKYNGRCSYCGIELKKGWHVDHIKPQAYGGTDDFENLNPSCKDCNNYKCFCNLDNYRTQLKTMLNERLDYLFKSKTKMQVAINMGSIKHTEWNGLFYFETLKEYNGKNVLKALEELRAEFTTEELLELQKQLQTVL